MEQVKGVCKTCTREFWIIQHEQDLLNKLHLPYPTECPTCRQIKRLKERGDRNLYKTVCQNCNKNIIVTFNPQNESRKILCKTCYSDWFEKNQVLVNN